MKYNKLSNFCVCLFVAIALVGCDDQIDKIESVSNPVDCVNPYMGGISHMLCPTYPTVSLPNSMLRFYPDRASYQDPIIKGLPLLLTSHRGVFAFHLSPINLLNTDTIPTIQGFTYDDEYVKPYEYGVYLGNSNCEVSFTPSQNSALFILKFDSTNVNHALVLNTSDGRLVAQDNHISGYQILQNDTKVYLYLETYTKPQSIGYRDSLSAKPIYMQDSAIGKTVLMTFAPSKKEIKVRYGVSFISVEQAKENLYSQIQTYAFRIIKDRARHAWEEALSKIEIEGGTPQQRRVFYTSLYRTYERMVSISENGRYYSAFDHKVHSDNGVPFYTDDWVWDTYRAVHPLRLIIAPKLEHDILCSYLRMADQSNPQWLPTFPEVTGDSHRMNGTNSISIFTDAACKNIGDIDLKKAYQYAKNTMEEKSYLPWTKIPKGKLSKFMDEKGYFPALNVGEKETDTMVTKWEKRQAVAVTLAASFDYWCLSKLAQLTGNDGDIPKYLQRSHFYLNVFNEKTKFFHPRNQQGQFIEPFNYELSGGQGARNYYDENNGYTYRYDLQQNPQALIKLMGGSQAFVSKLDSLFSTPITEARYDFYYQFPDQTGNVGQFTMANEPSMHIPYLYDIAGQPWKTQKVIHRLIHEWFRDDFMGVPGDEDGGGLSAFVVFSMIGFYPVSPGIPIYSIGSPFFPKVKIKLEGGRLFTVLAPDVSETNKYIQSATLNGKPLNRCWLYHNELIEGGELIFKMGPRPNKAWGTVQQQETYYQIKSNDRE